MSQHSSQVILNPTEFSLQYSCDGHFLINKIGQACVGKAADSIKLTSASARMLKTVILNQDC